MATGFLEPISTIANSGWNVGYSATIDAALAGSERQPDGSDYSNGYAYSYYDGSTAVIGMSSISGVSSVSQIAVRVYGENYTYGGGNEFFKVNLFINGTWQGAQAFPYFESDWSTVTFTGSWSSLDNVRLDFTYSDPEGYGSGTTIYRAYAEATYVQAPATAITLTGPTTGPVGVASTAFAYGLNGSYAGSSFTATPSDGGAGGTFSPSSFTLPFVPPTSLIPTLSSNTTPSGTASASTEYNGSYAAWMAFDELASTFWVSSGGGTQWLQYQFTSAQTATWYSHTTRNDGYWSNDGATAWTLQGSNNGSSWTTLDTRSSQAPTSQNQTRTYQVSAPGSYTYYRITVTASPSSVGMTAFRLFGTDPTSNATPTFTYTPASAGSKTISLSNTSGTLTNPSSSSYEATYTLTVGNASFETPSVTNSFSYNTTGGTWIFSTRSGITGGGGFGFSASPPDGTQAGLIQDYSTDAAEISQTLTGMLVGATYSVTVSMAARSGYSASPIECLWDGVRYGSVVSPTSTWTDYTFGSFVASAPSHVLKFRAASRTGGDRTSYLDKVRITYTPPVGGGWTNLNQSMFFFI